MDDLEVVPTLDLVGRSIDVLKSRLDTSSVEEIEADLEAAIEAASETIEYNGIEAENDNGSDDEDVETSDDSELLQEGRSYLLDFYSELRGVQEGIIPISGESKFRQVLYSLLKPGLIVDGQHRVYGAAETDERIVFPVCAMPETNWFEQVFQFILINQKAKPIKPAFLNTIIATSLTETEITELYERLKDAGVDVNKAQLMHRVNTDSRSPFQNMIDFEVEESPGFLQFPGMNKLVRSFQNVVRTHALLVHDPEKWSAGNEHWLAHFFALWRGIRDSFHFRDDRLWKRPTESNPNNLLKIVALQEIQAMMFDVWADSRVFQFDAPDETYEKSKKFWDDFPPQFFMDEWKKKGLQTSVGRNILRTAMTETRRNHEKKGWGHRRLGLFQDS